jgi:hypothetical protein
MEEDIELRATFPVEKYGADILSSSGEGTPVDGGSTPASGSASASIPKGWLEVWHSKSRRGALKPKNEEAEKGEELREGEEVGEEMEMEKGAGIDNGIVDIGIDINGDGDGSISGSLDGIIDGRVVRLEGCATV